MNAKRYNSSDSHDCTAISNSNSSNSTKMGQKNCSSALFFSKQPQQQKKSSKLSISVPWYVVVFVILSQVILQAAAVITTPISSGGFWIYTGPSIAVAVSGGIPIIVFYSSARLNYIRCGDSSCSASNTIQIIDNTSSGDVGTDVAIAIASSGFAVISYYDWNNANLMVARCNDLACSSPSKVTVDNDIGYVGRFTSIALQATTNYPVISYYDLTNLNLKVAACSSVDCTTKTITLVDGASTSVGMWSSLKLRSNGLPTIVYYDEVALKLMFVACGNFACNAGNTYKTLTASSIFNLGQYASLALDSQDIAAISYYDATNANLALTRCTDVTCSSSNTYYVDDVASNSVGTWSSVAIRPNGYPIISYIDSISTRLKIANCLNSICSQASITSPDTTSTGHALTSIALFSSFRFVVAYAAGSALKVYTDTICPPNSVPVSNSDFCECNSGFQSNTGYRWASLTSGETCSTVSCPANSAFAGSYDNSGLGGIPYCLCSNTYKSTSGDRYMYSTPVGTETCTLVVCPSQSSFYGYDTSNYPTCQCNSGYKSTSGDRLANLLTSETCTAVTCPTNSIFNNTYDGTGGIGFPICECTSGFKSTSGDRLAVLSTTPETCTTVVCPTSSVFHSYDDSNYPICQCNVGFTSTSGDRLASLITSETCISVMCPSASSFSDYDTAGIPYCQCNSGYTGLTGVVTSQGPTYISVTGSCQWICPANAEIVTINTSPACQCKEGYEDSVTGLSTVDQDGTCSLPCPEHSQRLSNGNCECEKGYYGDLESTRVVTPGVGAVCTSKCGYKGAPCTYTDNCCKPDKKFVCRNSQCALCRKLGSICTKNTQCCSGRCNRKASICRERA